MRLMRRKPPGDTLVAAVDLGSNSFHLMVAEVRGRDLRIIDRMREMLRFGSGLDARGNITPEASKQALACLRRFGQRLHTLDAPQVRAVGTNTLRRAKNAQTFLRRAEAALGHAIEVISGMEEARLIYQGVTSTLADSPEQRLVVDIGGGSTELIIGAGSATRVLESLHMGCVSMTDEYLSAKTPTRTNFRDAILTARQQLEPVQAALRSEGWQRAIGSSGTIRAVESVIRESGWRHDGITLECLHRLGEKLVAQRDATRPVLPGLATERAPVFAGGVAVLTAVFEALRIERMEVSPGALREGVLQDLLGRLHGEDVRADAVERLAMRYAVDIHQVKRVETTALEIHAAVHDTWHLPEQSAQLLSWAAWLHEVGLAIAHSSYHKHGAYIVANADLAGFSRQEQQLLASLVRLHRRRFAKTVTANIDHNWNLPIRRLAAILRIAVLLHRGRDPNQALQFKVSTKNQTLDLQFPRGWAKSYPLTAADMEEETRQLRGSGVRLSVR
ncbi:MAG: exopolyphosphatase [Gammaproteobacteria bacterium]